MKLLHYLPYGSQWELDRDKGLYQLRLDGSINYQSWEGGSAWEPQRLVMSEAINTSGGKALFTGRFGYWHNPTTGETRIYPVRGDTSKYLKIAPMTAKTMQVRQVGDKYIELFWEKPDGTERHSIIIYDRGFKTNIRVRKGYKGNGEFKWQFELVGLNRVGRRVYNGLIAVGQLPKLFATDSTGQIHAVNENISNGVLTMGIDITNPAWPIDIDPTFGPIGVNRDAHFRLSVPTEGSGQLPVTALNAHSVDITRTLLYYDISAIPPVATITSSVWELFFQQILAGPVSGRQMDLLRMIVPDWEDAGTSTLGDEANWLYYKNSNVAWPGGAGALGDTDNTDLVSAVVPGAPGVWIEWNPVDMTQDAIDNRSGILNTFLHFTDETFGGSAALAFSSLEHATPSQRPRFTVGYTVPSISGGQRIIYPQIVASRRLHRFR